MTAKLAAGLPSGYNTDWILRHTTALEATLFAVDLSEYVQSDFG